MSAWLRIPMQLAVFCLLCAVALEAVITGAYYYAEPGLPTPEELRNVDLQIPGRIYSRDGRLIQQYGEQKRTPLASFDAIPDRLVQAITAAEDDRFFEHSGIDILSTLRAVFNYVTKPGEVVPGASTITQQIARTTNLLSRDYALGRKIKEIYLAYRIEEEFSKEEILKLYLDTYPFGQRSFGVVAAARTYFNKNLNELTLSEIAIIAGIPQGPSIMNPYNGPERAANRRAYVLRRMRELRYITEAERNEALAEPILSQLFDPEIALDASYVADMAYAWCQQRFTKAACDSEGLKITTTIDSRLQRAANAALRDALEAYDINHGYRGPIERVDLDALLDEQPEWTGLLDDLLAEYPEQFGAEAAVILGVNELYADVYLSSAGTVSLGLESVAWAKGYIDDDRWHPLPDAVGDVLARGDIVRFRRTPEQGFVLYQEPDVEGALVSVDPLDGAVVALVGGYSASSSQFNRATARRQPGSSFKPFFYLSALANGFNLASIVNDAPLVTCEASLEECRPVTNYDGRYHGEVSLRYALTNSLNTVADRIAREVLPRNSVRYLERFGFGPAALPQNTSLALGSGSVTPLELASAYAILANGGYAVGIRPDQNAPPAPYFIQRVEDDEGNIWYDAALSVDMVCREPEQPAAADHESPELIQYTSQIFPPLRCADQVESPQRIFLITDVMKDVIKRGSGRAANRAFPNRNDLAGKTGTTTGPRDAWFAGFNADITAVVRVGFDVDTRDLGRGEQGGVTAIPAWIDFMREALRGMPDHSLPQPAGLVERRIDPATGRIAADCNPNAEFEWFLISDRLEQEPDTNCARTGSGLFDSGPAPAPGSEPATEPVQPAGPRSLFE